MRPDLVVEARAFLGDEFRDVEIGIDVETGRILAVKKTLTGAERRRFRGRLLVPSGIDLHVHFRDPGSAQKEDFYTGSVGAALGGVGTVLDMPNTDPVVDRPRRLEEKQEAVAAKACVDWGLWATLTPGSREALRLLKTAAGLKVYMADTTGIPAPSTEEELRARLEWGHRADRLAVVHAETGPSNAPRDLADHHRGRSPAGEAAAIALLARAAPRGDLVHVAHASCPEALGAARAAGLSAAVTPHHLLLAYDEVAADARGKVNPPLRSARERAELWAALAAREVPLIETDHAPHTPEEKARPFADAPAGVPGVQTAYPLLLREARRRGVPVDAIVRAFSEGPAVRLGLAKGRIAPGFDADFFLIDPRRTSRIRGAELASRCGWSPFEGWEAYRVETHYLRGEPVVEDHEWVGRRGRGAQVRPPEASRALPAWRAYVARFPLPGLPRSEAAAPRWGAGVPGRN